jgi:hypothetical protein
MEGVSMREALFPLVVPVKPAFCRAALSIGCK